VSSSTNLPAWLQEYEAFNSDITNDQLAIQKKIDLLANVMPSELSKENHVLQQKLKLLKAKIQSFRDFVEEQDSDEDIRYMMQAVHRHDILCQELHTSLRRATLLCQSNAEKLTREKLLEGAADRRKQQKHTYDAETLKRTSQSFTDAGRRTLQLLNENIDRSEQALQLLAKTSKTLKDTHSEHRTYQGILHSSKAVLTRLINRQTTDKILVWCAFLFFCLVVLYIVRKRLSPWFSMFSS